MAKTNISEEFGVEELKTERKVIAGPPGSMLKFPESKALKFLMIAMLTLFCLSAYNAMLHIGLHLAVSNPYAMEAEIGGFFLVLNSVMDLVVSCLGLVYQILKVIWKLRN